MLVFSFLAGQGIGSQNYLFVLLALTLPMGILVLRTPHLAFGLAWFLYFVLPYQALRISIPIFDSPLMVLAILLVAAEILKVVVFHEVVPQNPVYLPMVLWAGVLILFVAIQHGNRIATSTQWYLQGMWTFVVAILTIKTPRQAGVVLLAFYVALLVPVTRALPDAFSSAGLTFGQTVQVQDLRSETGVSFHLPQMAALAWSIPASLAMSSMIPLTLRIASMMAVIAMTILIISSGFGTPYITLSVAFVGVVVFQLAFRRTGSIGQTVLISLAMFWVLVNISGALSQLERISDPNDASVQARRAAMGPGLQAFLHKPLAGWGDYDISDAPSYVFVYSGHSSFVEIAVRYGLLGLIPITLLFSTMGYSLIQLAKKTLKPMDRAIVNGIIATFSAYIIQGMISVSIGIITWDTVFWFFMGLAVLWLSWLDTGKFEKLVEF